ncbi:MAG: hypothetical protein C0482_16250 [Gordonia sp.]|nr:hypothetical protein [Gordonia sp. (in: high G+C Gram-positive bacteria)]
MRVALAMASQLAQHRARQRQQRQQQLERTARERQADIDSREQELRTREAAKDRTAQQAARDKAAADRKAARDALFAERERHQTARRIAEYQLNRVDRDKWWENATPEKIATAYRQAQEWRGESGAAINAAEVIEERVGADKGLNLAELSEEDLDTALAEAYMTPRQRAQRDAERKREQEQGEGAESDRLIAQNLAESLVADADREDAQVDAELDADGGPAHTPVEYSPVAAKAREEIRAVLAGKKRDATGLPDSTPSPLLNLPPIPTRDGQFDNDPSAPSLNLPPTTSSTNDAAAIDDPAAPQLNLPDPTTGLPADSSTRPWAEVIKTGAQLATDAEPTVAAVKTVAADTPVGSNLDAAAAKAAEQRPAGYDTAQRREATEAWVRDNSTATEEAIAARMAGDISSAHPPQAAVGASPKSRGKANTTGQVRNLTNTHDRQHRQSR